MGAGLNQRVHVARRRPEVTAHVSYEVTSCDKKLLNNKGASS
jgi:hypothetical protein